MGRSVSTHSRAVATVYLNLQCEERDDWDSFCDDLFHNVIEPKYPSFEKCNRWEGRENHVIMQNQYCEVSVSEYCGLTAICLAPKDDPQAEGWTARIANKWQQIVTRAYRDCALAKIGTFSNGESVYNKI